MHRNATEITPLSYHFQSPEWHVHTSLIKSEFPKLFATVHQQLNLQNILFEVDLSFVNDTTIKEMNHQYRQKNNPTNVLSFPHPSQTRQGKTVVLGDIIFAHETIAHEAKTQHKSFDHHLYHLFIHGLLHLLGYDHQVEKEAQAMESLETKILAHHKIPDPYQEQ